MPPSNSKANYKTYEAQARMVRAIVAAHPEVKWNYKGKTIILFCAVPYLLPRIGLSGYTFMCIAMGRRLTLRPRNC